MGFEFLRDRCVLGVRLPVQGCFETRQHTAWRVPRRELFSRHLSNHRTMSAVCILAPVVVAAWPAFSSAVVAAAGSMGYVVADEGVAKLLGMSEDPARQSTVALDIPNSQIVTG